MILYALYHVYGGSFVFFLFFFFYLYLSYSSQVGHRDFDVEKRLRRDLKRTHALLSDAQLLLSTMEQTGQGHAPGTKEQLDRLQCQVGSYGTTVVQPINSAV